MKIRKFNENSVSSMTPENVYCLYDDNEHRIIELFLNEFDERFDEHVNRKWSDCQGSIYTSDPIFF